MPHADAVRSRARGALLGLAVGDALGTTLEFSPARLLPPGAGLLAGPHTEITGDGPFRLEPGECTDDTQMACCLAASLRSRGVFDGRDVLRRYRAWRRVAFDCGGTTGMGLAGHAKAMAESGQAGNGSLMRTAPIGVFFRSRSLRRRLAAIADSELTHMAMPCVLACTSFNTAIARAIMGDNLTNILAAVNDEVRLTHNLMWRGEAATSQNEWFSTYVDRIRAVTGGHYLPPAATGYVVDSWQLAFWELWHAPSFEAGLIDCVNRGGDADTNGAITGALLGAYYGEHAIPEAWVKAVMGAKGLRPAYHPRVLLELVP